MWGWEGRDSEESLLGLRREKHQAGGWQEGQAPPKPGLGESATAALPVGAATHGAAHRAQAPVPRRAPKPEAGPHSSFRFPIFINSRAQCSSGPSRI